MTPQRLPRPIPLRQLSLKLGDSAPYKWAIVPDDRGAEVRVPATQGSLDQLEESRLMAMLSVLRAIRPFVGGQKKINRWVNISSGFSHIFRDLNPVYQMDRLGDGEGGTWTTDPSGKHYSIENYAMRDVQKLCLLRDNFPLVSKLAPDVLDFLDIRLANGRVEVGAAFTLPPIPSTYDKTVMRAGPITADRPMVALTPTQLAALTAATQAHQHASDPVAHPSPADADDHKSVQLLLREFEETALDEEQRHFFQLMQFNGGKDARWSAADVALIAKLEDLTWNEWDAELRKPAPNWGLSRYWEIAHQQAHALAAFNTMANPQDVQMLYRLPCFDHLGHAKPIGECPAEDQGQVMARLRTGVFFQGGAL